MDKRKCQKKKGRKTIKRREARIREDKEGRKKKTISTVHAG